MISLYLVVEGQTEQTFVDTVLGPQLLTFGVNVAAKLVARRRDGVMHRGGVTNFPPIANTLGNLMKEHRRPGCFFSSMLDLYKYPSDAPGREDAKVIATTHRRVERLEAALATHFADARFLPYIQVHEFEALLFTDPKWLEYSFPSQKAAVDSLVTMATQLAWPEDINDNEQTAPSKRIIAAIPDYKSRKLTAGPQTAELIGLDAIRAKCPHFNAWVTRLEGLAIRTV